jgi:hypothetical protein
VYALCRPGWAAAPPTLAFVLALVVGLAVAAPGRGSVGPPRQELALLLAPHSARAAPSQHAAVLQRVSTHRPLTGEQTALPVLGHTTSRDGLRWLHVLLPGRPNGHSGWIRKQATTAATTAWRLTVQTSTRRVRVYRNGHPARTFTAVVGKPSTPAPHGRFFVEESIRLTNTAIRWLAARIRPGTPITITN